MAEKNKPLTEAEALELVQLEEQNAETMNKARQKLQQEKDEAEKKEAEAAAKAAAPVAKAFAAVLQEFGFKPQTAPQPGAQPQVNKETTILTTKLSTNAKYGIATLALVAVVAIVVGVVLFNSSRPSTQAPVAKAPATQLVDPTGYVKKPVSDKPSTPAVDKPAPAAPQQTYDRVQVTLKSPSKEVLRVFAWYKDGLKIADDQQEGLATTTFEVETGKVLLVNAGVRNYGDTSSVIGWATDDDQLFGNTNSLQLSTGDRSITLSRPDLTEWNGNRIYQVVFDQYGIPRHVGK